MKKYFSILLIIALLLFCTAGALAEVPSLSEGLFKAAKSALTSLASGEYDKVVTTLPFSDISPSADEWRSFAQGSFSSLTGASPQTKYAVAYWTGRIWKLAVPVAEPANSGVEALVLASEDGRTFTGYACASWGSVQKEFESSAYVSWNKEYNASTSVVIEFDED